HGRSCARLRRPVRLLVARTPCGRSGSRQGHSLRIKQRIDGMMHGWGWSLSPPRSICVEPCRLRSLLRLAAFLALAAPAAFAAEVISVTVDATETSQKLLHTKLIIPVK